MVQGLEAAVAEVTLTGATVSIARFGDVYILSSSDGLTILEIPVVKTNKSAEPVKVLA